MQTDHTLLTALLFALAPERPGNAAIQAPYTRVPVPPKPSIETHLGPAEEAPESLRPAVEETTRLLEDWAFDPVFDPEPAVERALARHAMDAETRAWLRARAAEFVTAHDAWSAQRAAAAAENAMRAELAWRSVWAGRAMRAIMHNDVTAGGSRPGGTAEDLAELEARQ